MEEQSKNGNETTMDIFNRWMKDPGLAQSLNSELEDYFLRIDRNFDADQSSIFKNINRAEVLGLTDFYQANRMINKIYNWNIKK